MVSSWADEATEAEHDEEKETVDPQHDEGRQEVLEVEVEAGVDFPDGLDDEARWVEGEFFLDPLQQSGGSGYEHQNNDDQRPQKDCENLPIFSFEEAVAPVDVEEVDEGLGANALLNQTGLVGTVESDKETPGGSA